MDREQNDNLTKCYNERKKLLEELRRRVDITYRVRIIAANRLRNDDKEYKKINMYYSVLVTGLSILVIGKDSNKIGNVAISNIILMLSILLNYFISYISAKNLQERAYKMEETFKNLDKLKNKLDITLKFDPQLEEDKCKKLHQEYERILISIENHEDIDYQIYKLNDYKKHGVKYNEQPLYEDIKKKVKQYHNFRWLEKYILKYSIPTIIAVILMGKIFMK